MVTGPAGLGSHRPRQLVKIESRRDAENIIKTFLPDLWDKLQAATTEQQKQQVLREIRDRHPEVIAQAEEQLATLSAEDL
jgi:GTP1/Obg family GTP-binding protein